MKLRYKIAGAIALLVAVALVSLPLEAVVISPFLGQKFRPFLAELNKEDLAILGDLLQAGKVTPVIDRSYSLKELPAAIAYLEEGHARGKVVITVE